MEIQSLQTITQKQNPSVKTRSMMIYKIKRLLFRALLQPYKTDYEFRKKSSLSFKELHSIKKCKISKTTSKAMKYKKG